MMQHHSGGMMAQSGFCLDLRVWSAAPSNVIAVDDDCGNERDYA